MAAAGCNSEDTRTSAPEEGGVRLVSIDDIGSPTAECDPVHFGGVEVFTGGMGRICDADEGLGNIFHCIATQVRQSSFIHTLNRSSRIIR